MRCQILTQTPGNVGKHRVVSLASALGKLANAVVKNKLVVMDVQGGRNVSDIHQSSLKEPTSM